MVDEESAGDALLGLAEEQPKKEEPLEESQAQNIQVTVEEPVLRVKKKAPAKKAAAKKKVERKKEIDFSILDGLRQNFTRILSTVPERDVLFLVSQEKFRALMEDMSDVCMNKGRSVLVLDLKEGTEKNKAELGLEVQRFKSVVVDDATLAYKISGCVGASRNVILSGPASPVFQKNISNVYELLEKV